MRFIPLAAHHWRKDFCHLRPWLAVWGVLLLMQAGAMSPWFAHIPGNGGWWLLSIPFLLAPVLQGVVLALAIALLIQDESPADREGYWLTRPISPWPLLVSKLIFALCFFVLVPVLVEAVAFLTQGFPGNTVAAALGEVGFQQLVMVAIFAALATLTPDLLRFVTWLVVLVACYAVLLLVLETFENGVRSGPVLLLAGGSAADVVPTLRAGAIALIFAAAVIVLQFLTRRLAVGAGLATAGAALCLWAGHFMPVDDEAGLTADAYRAGVVQFHFDFRDAEWVRSGNSPGRDQRILRVPLEYTGLESDRYLIPERARTRLSSSDRTPGVFDPVVQSETEKFTWQRHAAESQVAGIRLIEPPEEERRADLLHFDRALYLVWRDRRANLEVDLTLREGRLRALPDLELTAGAAIRTVSDHTAVRRVREAEGEFVIDLDVRRVRLLLDDDPAIGWREIPGRGGETIFLLVNRERREAVAPSRRIVSPLAWPGNRRRVVTERISLTFGEGREELGSEEEVPVADPLLDEDWLADAVLVGFRISGVDRFREKVVMRGIDLPEWE